MPNISENAQKHHERTLIRWFRNEGFSIYCSVTIYLIFLSKKGESGIHRFAAIPAMMSVTHNPNLLLQIED
jgi:hypothetical protein